MIELMAKIADRYGLYDLHKNYTKKDQFYYDKSEISKVNIDFYARPDIPELKFEKSDSSDNYEYGTISFSSQVDGDGKDAVFYYATKNTKKPVNIIMIHGWRSKLNKLDNIFKEGIMQEGFNAYSYVLPYHLERAPQESAYNGEYFLTANTIRTLNAFKQAVSDIRALIRYIKDIKKETVYIIGLSLGGLVSNLVCEHEDVDALASLFYANDLAYTIFHATSGKYIKRDFVNNKFYEEQLSDCWKIINPSLSKPIIDKNKILLVSGRYDEYVLPPDTNKLWEAWGRPQRYVYDCGHSGIVLLKKKIRDNTMKFLRGIEG
ncbi:alpha/beta fold hydrolase [Acetivibrio cellulolyticus]|uniref:YdjC n=1 Tax=Acetivibrio cellulolyticus TaxID=35830 RepID=UPI0001E2C795|nr:YdjC [Acetivibrio cellulolyticus]